MARRHRQGSRRASRIAGLLAAALAASWLVPVGTAQAPAARPVAVITIEGALGVPMAGYLERAIQEAEAQGAQCLVVRLNTPGGLGQPMMDMVKALLNAPLPVIVYVSPAGAQAMSAGTFVTLAAHVAAMHPATTIGAAHPVELLSVPVPEEEGEGKEGKRPVASQEVMMEKTVNAFAKQARVIAEERGRNVDWAERAVRESATASATEAQRLGVVDLVVRDMAELLAQVDGRQVMLASRRKAVLATRGAPVVEIPPTVKESFLHVLANPNILLVLLVLAGLGIMFELQNPGAILPGVIGGMCLLLALYSMAVLPVNYAGVGLVLFAMGLFLAEVKVVSHGILTVGGVVSFVLGALMLTGSQAPWLRVSWQVITVLALLLLFFFFFVIGAAIRAHMRRVETGEEGIVRQRGRAIEALAPAGRVMVEGEQWRARAVEGEIAAGEEVEVVGKDGLTLFVQRSQAKRLETRKG